MRKPSLLPSLLLPGLLLSGAALSGCESSLGPDASPLSVEDARLLASEFDAIGNSVIDGMLGGFAPSFSLDAGAGSLASVASEPVTVTFTRTQSCPKGGQVTVAGTTIRDVNRETRSMATETSATKTHARCAVEGRNGVTITTNGNPNIALKATRKVVSGQPSGLQTSSQKGSFTYSTSDGRSGTCTIDITSTFDPATKTHTIKGTNCGRTVDSTRTRGS